MDEHEGCPHCGNKVGFVFGTCIECGFNKQEMKFKFIKVDTRALYDEQRYLIAQHAANTFRNKQ